MLSRWWVGREGGGRGERWWAKERKGRDEGRFLTNEGSTETSERDARRKGSVGGRGRVSSLERGRGYQMFL
jgi:hypothetical protein